MEGNLAENWARWHRKVAFYILSCANIQTDLQKVGVLLSLIGDSALDVISTLKFTHEGEEFTGTIENANKLKYDDLVKQISEYCSPRKTVLLERYRFWQRQQKPDETADQYSTELRRLYTRTEYGANQEELIRDQFIFGMTNQEARIRLLQEDYSKLTLEKAISYCRVKEATEIESQEMSKVQAHSVQKKKPQKFQAQRTQPQKTQPQRTQPQRTQTQKKDGTFMCKNCATEHGRRECPAYGKRCNGCQKLNHYKKCCRSKVETVNEDTLSVNNVSSFFIGSLKNSDVCKSWYTYINVAGINVKFKLDTGAEANILQALIAILRSGWPEHRTMVPESVKQYWQARQEIHEADGLLFCKDRILVPPKMKKEILRILHEGHMGIDKTRARARDILYWPGMSQDIEDLIQKCDICIQQSSSQRRESMILHEIPERPWMKIGADIFQLGRHDYLCLVDYYSKFPVIRQLKGKTADAVIINLKSVFAEYGIPQEVISDNMPFSSVQFQEFATSYGFNSTTSSPTYSQSNGQVERTIGTVKKMLKKATDPYLALLEYRNTTIKGMKYSPAQILNSRRLRSKLPVSTKALEPEVTKDAHTEMLQLRDKMKKQYDQGSRDLAPLQAGAKVWARMNNTWKPARIQTAHGSPRSYLLESESGHLIRRNRRQLKPRYDDYSPVLEYLPIDLDQGDQVPDQPEVEVPVQVPNQPEVPEQATARLTTRSGRVLKPPDRLDL